jgi:hypothetical protein
MPTLLIGNLFRRAVQAIGCRDGKNDLNRRLCIIAIATMNRRFTYGTTSRGQLIAQKAKVTIAPVAAIRALDVSLSNCHSLRDGNYSMCDSAVSA